MNTGNITNEIREALVQVREARRKLDRQQGSLAKKAASNTVFWARLLDRAVITKMHEDSSLVRKPFILLKRASLTAGWEHEDEGVVERLRLEFLGSTEDGEEEAHVVLNDLADELKTYLEWIQEGFNLDEGDLESITEAMVHEAEGFHITLASVNLGG